MPGVRIDCDECTQQHTATCEDCLVTFLVGREADDAVVIDVLEERKLRQLQDVGLVPRLRHQPRTG